jgi:UDP-N-acetylglucosamine 2-epimerase (non-hydrolysing)
VLGTPCLTLRTETERPITVTQGTNVVAGVTKESIIAAYKKVDFTKRPAQIPLWDGKTAQRIVDILEKA